MPAPAWLADLTATDFEAVEALARLLRDPDASALALRSLILALSQAPTAPCSGSTSLDRFGESD